MVSLLEIEIRHIMAVVGSFVLTTGLALLLSGFLDYSTLVSVPLVVPFIFAFFTVLLSKLFGEITFGRDLIAAPIVAALLAAIIYVAGPFLQDMPRALFIGGALVDPLMNIVVYTIFLLVAMFLLAKRKK